MDFEFIQQFHKNPPRVNISRKPFIEELYQKEKRKKNYEDNLHNVVFPHPLIEWNLLVNKFPYDFKDNTVHFVLWFRKHSGKCFENALDKIGAVYYENLKINRSVVSMRHIHVFVNNISLTVYKIHNIICENLTCDIYIKKSVFFLRHFDNFGTESRH